MSKKTPVVLQKNQYECGLAALAMLFSYNDTKISTEALRGDNDEIVNRDGLSLLELKNIAQKNQAELKVYKTSNIENFMENYNFDKPLLAYFNNNHYVIVTDYKNKEVWLNDPQIGRYPLEIDEFSQQFTNFIGILEKDFKNRKIFAESSQQRSSVWSLIKDFKYNFLWTCCW